MSSLSHEAVCLDSLQKRLFWFDDFEGDQLKDEWDLTVVATGVGAVIDLQTGAIYRLSAPTNATADEARIDWGNIRSLISSKRVSIEWHIKLSSIANVLVQLGLYDDANDLIWFEFDTAVDADWHIETISGGVPTNQSSTIAATTNYVILRIECHLHGGAHIHFYIDGVQATNSPLTTNVSTVHLQPYARILTRAAAEKQVDLDYAYARQDR